MSPSSARHGKGERGASQAIVYVPNAVPEGNVTRGLQPLSTAGNATHLSLVPPDHGEYNDTNTCSYYNLPKIILFVKIQFYVI
jgi:hypothetical protein